MKELKYHPLYYEMLICTAEDGFNLFKPALNEDLSEDEEEDDGHEQIPEIKEKDLEKYLNRLSLH